MAGAQQSRELPDIIYPQATGYGKWQNQDTVATPKMEPPGLTFSAALDAMKRGAKVSRNLWGNNDMWMAIQMPDNASKMSIPYTYIHYSATHQRYSNGQVPWVVNNPDIMATDWFLVTT